MFILLLIGGAAFLALNSSGAGGPPPTKGRAPSPAPAPAPTYTPPRTTTGATDMDALRTGIDRGADIAIAIIERLG